MRYAVGLEDSPSGRAALRWAVGTATVTGASVEVVTAFRTPIAWSPERGPVPTDAAAARVAARTAQAHAARTALGSAADAADVSLAVRNGDATDVLVEQSESADVLVIGAGTGRRLRRLLRPPLGRRVARFAQCPVVFVGPGHDVRVAGPRRSSSPARDHRTRRLAA